jgi:hypothetical protein
MVQELKKLAAEKGRTLSSVCDELRIARSVIHRWEKRTPQSLVIYNKLKDAIERLPASRHN